MSEFFALIGWLSIAAAIIATGVCLGLYLFLITLPNFVERMNQRTIQYSIDIERQLRDQAVRLADFLPKPPRRKR